MGLEISFANRQLRDICENEAKAKKTYGDLCSKNLFSRLSDLKAAETIYDVIAGNPSVINPTEISISLDENLKLIITANHTSNPLDNNAEIDWWHVSRIKITSIEETNHD